MFPVSLTFVSIRFTVLCKDYIFHVDNLELNLQYTVLQYTKKITLKCNFVSGTGCLRMLKIF